MIESWKVSNFKSIRAMPEALEFAPLTIFCGANSSGKSALLQSILLLKQTLRKRGIGSEIALNGDILKLGKFSEIKSHKAGEADTITIDFRLRDYKDDKERGFSHNVLRSIRVDYKYKEDTLTIDTVPKSIVPRFRSELVDCSLNFGFSEKDDTGDPKDSAPPVERAKIKRESAPPVNKVAIRNVSQDKSIVIDGKGRVYTPGDEFLSLLNLRTETEHFLPSNPVYCDSGIFCFGQMFKTMLEEYSELDMDPAHEAFGVSFLSAYNNWSLDRNAIAAFQKEIDENDFLDAFELAYHPRDIDKKWGFITFSAFKAGIEKLYKDAERKAELKDKIEETRNKYFTEGSVILTIQSFLNTALSSDSSFEFKNSLSKPVSQAIDTVYDFFMKKLYYIGPLRADPKAGETGEGDLDGVGFKGEYTAEFYCEHSQKPILYIPTWYFDPANYGNHIFLENARYLPSLYYNVIINDINSVFLCDAVNDWLRYLGAADGIEPVDHGEFGYGFKIKKSGKDHSLTNLGVGVSQVLPIVVMCLAAERDAAVIIEQPELHLHPKMQSRLADFFISMAFLGKQIIIETHSEYLIDKLRLRIFQDSTTKKDSGSYTEFGQKKELGDAWGHIKWGNLKIDYSKYEFLRDITRLYFVENRDGESEFTRIRFNKSGGTYPWPEDFFDESFRIRKEITEHLQSLSDDELAGYEDDDFENWEDQAGSGHDDD